MPMTKQWLDSALRTMIERGGSVPDFLFLTGKFPVAQRHAGLEEFQVGTTSQPLSETEIQDIATLIIGANARLLDDFEKRGSCDCSYSLPGVARFRVNIYKERGRHAIAMRRLPVEIPTIEALGLSAVFHEMVREKTGVIFVTGATGSGKTTTLAALLDEINKTQEVHIVTLEDPIEFVHPHQRSIFSQRELGKDFPNFAEGLRAALRQAPKVILVGEIRDRDSMEIALTASETGHLVFATLHTIDAGQTINRILGMFGKEEEQQIRQRLADTVRYIVSQRLVSRVDGERMLVTEIMGSSLRTREALLYGEAEHRMFRDIIESGVTMGWHTFDHELLKAFKANQITEDCAVIFASNKTKIRQEIELVKKKQTPEHRDVVSGLKMEESPLITMQRQMAAAAAAAEAAEKEN